MLRFLMSHHRKNIVRDKVKGKKWIYSDSQRSTLSRQCGPSQRAGAATKCGIVNFYRLVTSYANEWKDYSNYFGEEVKIARI